MDYRRSINNWDAGLWPFKGQRPQTGPLPAAHDAYLHTSHVVVLRVKSCRYVLYAILTESIE